MVPVSSLFIVIILITCKVDRLVGTENDTHPDAAVANSIKATPDELGNIHVHVHGDQKKSVTIHLKDVHPQTIQIHLHTGSDSSDDSKKVDTASPTTEINKNDDMPPNDDTSSNNDTSSNDDIPPDQLSSQDNPPSIPSNNDSIPQIPMESIPSDQMESQDTPYHTNDTHDMQQQQQQQQPPPPQDIASAESMDGEQLTTNPSNSDEIPSDQAQLGDGFDCMKELEELRESHKKLMSDKDMLLQQIEKYRNHLLPMMDEVNIFASDARHK